ncbi:MAG: hypothetical protein P4L46_01390 [Fimbriimonas sp.]|nr:hypothetical protein [Fimbriimonas sp.]
MRSAIETLVETAQDLEGFGRHAVELLLDRIAGEAPETPRHVLLDAPLLVRHSIAAPNTNLFESGALSA